MSLLLHRDYVANAAALALNVGGLRRSLYYRGMPTALELFRRAIQRKQFKSVTYSNVKVHLFDFPIRFADLTIVNLSPANFSPPLLSSLSPPHSPLPLADFLLFSSKPFYYCSCQSCTFKVPITRERYPPSILFLPTSPRGGVPAVVTASFTSASGVPKIDWREAGESYEETILIWKSGEIAKNRWSNESRRTRKLTSTNFCILANILIMY